MSFGLDLNHKKINFNDDDDEFRYDDDEIHDDDEIYDLLLIVELFVLHLERSFIIRKDFFYSFPGDSFPKLNIYAQYI